MTSPRDRFAESLGLTIHFLEWGEPSETPIVLVHGFLDQAFSWSLFAAELLRRARRPLWLIAPDCRGHGDSGWVGAGGYYHFPDYVFDLDCVMRTVGAKQLRLIGHSMGGTISFLYAGAFPDKVTKLVLIEGIGPLGMEFADAPVRMAGWIDELHGRGRNHFREYTSTEAGANQLRQTNPRLSKDFAAALAEAGMRQNQRGKWVWKFDPLHRTAAPQPFYTRQALEFLKRIRCPVLIVDGEDSHQSRRTDKQARYEALPSYQLARIPNAGHMVHQDNPEVLAQQVDNFFGIGGSRDDPLYS
jgi:pimeloyl-ACP methyl ester carboxylesterase